MDSNGPVLQHFCLIPAALKPMGTIAERKTAK
jgi:hypothetical protein